MREISAEDLFKNYISKSRPIIFENLAFDWFGDDDNLFAKEFFIDNFGDNIVKVSVSENGRFDGPEDGKLWGLGSNVDVLVR